MKKHIVFMMLVGMLVFPTFAEVAAGNVAEDGEGIIEPDEEEAGELARKTQNPIADLISLPFQWNV
ncbi:MAG: hypothetical protein ACYSTT_17115, partial [Planctomycetota bacterium]